MYSTFFSSKHNHTDYIEIAAYKVFNESMAIVRMLSWN